MPVGDDVTLNLSECNLFAIFSAKHDPMEKIVCVWSIFSAKGFISVFVYSCISPFFELCGYISLNSSQRISFSSNVLIISPIRVAAADSSSCESVPAES